MSQSNQPSAKGSLAMVFPGQGAQKPGMGDSFRSHPAYRQHLAEADEVLGFGLSQLMATGSQQELTRTEVAQVALLTVATGIYRVWQAEGGAEPTAVAGHSLGEYSALVVAGVLEFEAALRLVQLRGQLMQQACEQVPGSMAAVIRPETEAIAALCRQSGQVVIANANSPQQIVLSGESQALLAVISQIKAAKLGKAIPLKVSGAFHSTLMEPARQALAEAINQADFGQAAMPVVMNVTGQARRAGPEIQALLCRQITAPVLWSETVLSLSGYCQIFAELGPLTLTPLIRQTLPEALTFSLATWPDLDAYLSD